MGMLRQVFSSTAFNVTITQNVLSHDIGIQHDDLQDSQLQRSLSKLCVLLFAEGVLINPCQGRRMESEKTLLNLKQDYQNNEKRNREEREVPREDIMAQPPPEHPCREMRLNLSIPLSSVPPTLRIPELT